MLDQKDFLPKFLTTTPKEEKLPTKLTLPKPSKWKTLYIGGGKKTKSVHKFHEVKIDPDNFKFVLIS